MYKGSLKKSSLNRTRDLNPYFCDNGVVNYQRGYPANREQLRAARLCKVHNILGETI